MKNKILSFAIVLCMLFGIMVMPVSAENTEGYFTYYVTPAKEAIVTKVDSSISGNVVVPSKTNDGYWVRGIGERAFNGCAGIKSLTIGDVAEIDSTAFMLSSNIESITVLQGNNYYSSEDGVLFNIDKTAIISCPCGKSGVYTIPSSVKEIGEWAFYNCERLTSVTIPEGIKTISCESFSYCTGLTTINIPNGVETIEGAAFGGCFGLKSITIPNSVSRIEEHAFFDCYDLADVYYNGSEAEWNNIEIDNEYHDNDFLLNAIIHFNSIGDGSGSVSGGGTVTPSHGGGTPWTNGVIVSEDNLDIEDFSYSYEPGEDENNEGSVGFMDLNFMVTDNITNKARMVWICSWREGTPPSQEEIVNSRNMMISIWKKYDASRFYFNTAPYPAGGSFPIYSDDLGKTLYVLLVGLDENIDWAGNVLVKVDVPGGSGSSGSGSDGSGGGTVTPSHGGGTSSGSELQKLPSPTNLRWNEDEEGNVQYGRISWDSVQNCEGSYYIRVYCNGAEVFKTSWTGLYYGERQSVGVVHGNVFNKSGDYTFSIVAEGDDSCYLDSEPAISGVYHFTAPDKKLETPTDLQWIGNGVLKHKAIDNVDGYKYTLYNQNKKEVGWSTSGSMFVNPDENNYEEYDLSDYIIELSGWTEDLKGIYVTVQALTRNIEEYQNSDESQFSSFYDIEAAKSVALTGINDVLADMDEGTSTAAEALDSFLEQMEDNSIENKDIAISMQKSEQLVNNISRLEAAYCEEKGIEVSVGNSEDDAEYLETKGIDVNKVTVVGAALNSQDGADVSISFSKVEEMPEVNESYYKNSVAVNIGIDGVKDAEKLDIPIQIKMPVPTGVLPDRLVIIHYHADGTSEEIHPAVSYDAEENAYVTFVLTSFSTFVFCNEPEPAPTHHSTSGGGGGGGGTPSITVKFDTNGGDELKNISVQKGQKIGTIKTPEKKGFVFEGWYADKELTKAYSADEEVKEETTLYAGWKVDPVRQLTLKIGDTKATVFGAEQTNDVAPIIRNSRTMLPIRFIAEALGAKVEWDADNRIVTITKGEKAIKITIDKGVALVNGNEISLDSPAFIESDRTFLPLRFVSENLGAAVEWVEETKQVVITKPIEE